MVAKLTLEVNCLICGEQHSRIRLNQASESYERLSKMHSSDANQSQHQAFEQAAWAAKILHSRGGIQVSSHQCPCSQKMLKTRLRAMHIYVGYVTGPQARVLLIPVLCLMGVNSGTITSTSEEWTEPKDWDQVYILCPGRPTGLGKRKIPKEIRKVIFLNEVLRKCQVHVSSCIHGF